MSAITSVLACLHVSALVDGRTKGQGRILKNYFCHIQKLCRNKGKNGGNEVKHAPVYTVSERICLHPGMGIFAGAVYESMQQP